MSQREQRQLREGAGDAFSAAFEMIVTPAIFGLIGWLVDRQLGTFPVFALSLAFLVLTYEIWKITSRYNAQLDAELEARRAGYGQSTPSAGEVGV